MVIRYSFGPSIIIIIVRYKAVTCVRILVTSPFTIRMKIAPEPRVQLRNNCTNRGTHRIKTFIFILF